MKTIGIAIVSSVAAFLGSANAGNLPSLTPMEADFHIQPVALDANRPAPQETSFVSIESSDPTRLQLNCWALAGATADAPSESAVALYLKFGARSSESAFSPARMAAILSHAVVIPGPIVRSIDVQYPGANERNKTEILAKMRTRVGQHYSEKLVNEDIRALSAIEAIKRVRIFGEPTADGVKLMVIVQPKAGFDFNIGYQF